MMVGIFLPQSLPAQDAAPVPSASKNKVLPKKNADTPVKQAAAPDDSFNRKASEFERKLDRVKRSLSEAASNPKSDTRDPRPSGPAALPAVPLETIQSIVVPKKPAPMRAAQAPPAPSGKLDVKGFRYTGNTVLTKEELDTAVFTFINQKMGITDLERVADEVTKAYKRRGYVLAKAYIPKQEVKDGIVEIAILEGKVGELIVTGNEYYSTNYIKRYLGKVTEGTVVKQQDLERSLLLLNDHPDLNVTASLEPGKTPGSTDLTAKVKDKRPIHFLADYNNFGVPFISRNRYGFGVELGNVIVEGSVLTLRSILGDDPEKLAFQMGTYVVPLTGQGTKLVVSGSRGNFDVGGELASLLITGKILTYDVSVMHPVVKSRFENLSIEAGYVSKDNKLFILNAVSGDDKLRMAKVGFNYDRTDNSGRNFLSAYGFQGLGEILGAMSNQDPLATRRGADNRFTKGTLALGRIQSLPYDSFLILRGQGQITDTPLPIIEQFMLGGPDSVRGYLLGQNLGDEGYNVSMEARLPVPLVPQAQFVGFIDNGAVRLRNPQVGEKQYVHLTGAGPGVRINLPYYEMVGRLDVGFPLVPGSALGGTLNGGSSPSVYAQVSGRF
jgi:hemolysin activation/secretion protein